MTPKEQWEANQKANGLGITWEEHLAQREQDFAMAILNGLSGSNACKGADERRRMIPIKLADQAVANCEAEIAKLRESNYQLNLKGQAMAGYLQALAAMPEIKDGGELQRLLVQAVAEWDETAAKDGWKPLNR